MFFPSFHSFLQRVVSHWPVILQAATWTILLGLTVAMTSFVAKIMFVSAVYQSSWFSRSCNGDGLVRLPMDLPGELFCLPAQMVRRSEFDFFVPFVFAALMVAGSACLLRSLLLWDDGDGGGGGGRE